MKLEPVAIPQWLLDAIDSYAACSDDDDRSIVARRVVVEKLRQFSAIPEGYVVVPVSLLKRANAAMMEWAAKYGEHNPQWLPPARVSELHAEIESMIAAKEQQ